MPWAPHGLLLQALFAVNVENLHFSCPIESSDRFYFFISLFCLLIAVLFTRIYGTNITLVLSSDRFCS